MPRDFKRGLNATPLPADPKERKEATKAAAKASSAAVNWPMSSPIWKPAWPARKATRPSCITCMSTPGSRRPCWRDGETNSGDPENLTLWKEFLPACMEEIDRIYRRLDVRFDHTLGESFYHDRLASVVADLESRGLARQSEGATCVFLEGFSAPFIIRKQDGAFLYATTDLATIQYRVETWKPDAILYVVDFRQGLHFEQLFATARLWGYDAVELAHVSFGTVLGAGGKPIKPRSGESVTLEGLLDEAVERAFAIVTENNPELPGAERKSVSEAVGIGALKYADLSQNRTSDYEFSYDKMLAMNGNTATTCSTPPRPGEQHLRQGRSGHHARANPRPFR